MKKSSFPPSSRCFSKLNSYFLKNKNVEPLFIHFQFLWGYIPVHPESTSSVTKATCSAFHTGPSLLGQALLFSQAALALSSQVHVPARAPAALPPPAFPSHRGRRNLFYDFPSVYIIATSVFRRVFIFPRGEKCYSPQDSWEKNEECWTQLAVVRSRNVLQCSKRRQERKPGEKLAVATKEVGEQHHSHMLASKGSWEGNGKYLLFLREKWVDGVS